MMANEAKGSGKSILTNPALLGSDKVGGSVDAGVVKTETTTEVVKPLNPPPQSGVQSQQKQEEAGKAKQDGTQQAPKDENAKADAKGSGDAGAPEDVEVSLPEGMQADAALMDGFKAIAKEAKLGKETSQKLVTLFATRQQELQQQNESAFEQERQGWVRTIRTDQELGNQNLPKTLANIDKAMARFGTPELRKVLEDSGLGDNPEFVRLLARVGAADAEDRIESKRPESGGGERTEEDLHRALYPTMFPKAT